MSVSRDYSTGCYSVSPCFAWWYSSIHRMDKLKKSNEAKRVIIENKEKDTKNVQKVKEGTISVYA
jgi:hypothetical protein